MYLLRITRHLGCIAPMRGGIRQDSSMHLISNAFPLQSVPLSRNCSRQSQTAPRNHVTSFEATPELMRLVLACINASILRPIANENYINKLKRHNSSSSGLRDITRLVRVVCSYSSSSDSSSDSSSESNSEYSSLLSLVEGSKSSSSLSSSSLSVSH